MPNLPFWHIRPTLHIRRNSNEFCKSLPMPWMWAVPAGADVCGVRLGDAEGMGESEMQQNGYSVAFGVHLLRSYPTCGAAFLARNPPHKGLLRVPGAFEARVRPCFRGLPVVNFTPQSAHRKLCTCFPARFARVRERFPWLRHSSEQYLFRPLGTGFPQKQDWLGIEFFTFYRGYPFSK